MYLHYNSHQGDGRSTVASHDDLVVPVRSRSMRQIYPLMAPLALALPLLAANTAHANPAGNKLAVPSPPPATRTASPNSTTTQPTQATTNAVPANPKPAQATANTTPANAKPAPVTTAPLPTAATLKVEMPTPTPTPVNVQQFCT